MSKIIIESIPLWEWLDLHEILNVTPKADYWARVRNYPHILGFSEKDYQLLKGVLKEVKL